jgi:hypothetical protein
MIINHALLGRRVRVRVAVGQEPPEDDVWFTGKLEKVFDDGEVILRTINGPTSLWPALEIVEDAGG